MAGLFDDAILKIPCGRCGHKMPQTVRRLKGSPDLTCPSCGTITKLDASQFGRSLKNVDKAVDDLKRTFSKLGKGR